LGAIQLLFGGTAIRMKRMIW